ncbi:hypothetical protein GF357_00685 [Candidatus Dojkabacteria bacterium]|nr:hypothetical protein [Candidatus Dojkabacteria bacterium]
MNKKISKFFALSAAVLCAIAVGFNAPGQANAQDTTDSYIEELEQALVLNMPEVTDNPDHNITFTDPSGKGVDLTIDEDEDYPDIESPFKLPTLSIGEHTLVFEFYDIDSTKQALEKDLVVIPRPPQISSRTEEEGKLKLTGTAVGDAQIKVFISEGRDTILTETEVDNNGNWELTVDETLDPGRYIVAAIVRKNGIASDFSEVSAFDLQSDGSEDSKFSFYNEYKIESIQLEELPNIILNNQNVAIYTLVLILLGLFFGYVIKTLMSSGSMKGAEKMLREALGSQQAPQTTQPDSKPKSDSKSDSAADNDSDKKSGGLFAKLGRRKTQDKTAASKKEDKFAALQKKNNLKQKLQARLSKKQPVEKSEPKEDLESDQTTPEQNAAPEQQETTTQQQSDNKGADSENAGKDSKNGDTPQMPNPESSKKDEPKSKKNMTGRVLNKDDFLKEFEKFDPDDEDGKEVKPRKMTDSDILQAMSSLDKSDEAKSSKDKADTAKEKSKPSKDDDSPSKPGPEKGSEFQDSKADSSKNDSTDEKPDSESDSADTTKDKEPAQVNEQEKEPEKKADESNADSSSPKKPSEEKDSEKSQKSPEKKDSQPEQTDTDSKPENKTEEKGSADSVKQSGKTNADSPSQPEEKPSETDKVPDSRNLKITLTSDDSEEKGSEKNG